MNGPSRQQGNCSGSIQFIRRFALRPRWLTRATGQCIPCDYAPGQGCSFTQEQLDMRRKAEVLQYKNNASFTGAMTKAEKYSMIARRKGPNQKTYGTQTQTLTNPNALNPQSTNPGALPVRLAYNALNPMPSAFVPTDRRNCPRIDTSTHGSDVPGPAMELYMDEDVPLTNYVVRRNYAGNHSASRFVFKPASYPPTGGTYFIPSTD